MEAVPRLPMLSFDLKSSAESVEFGPKLRQYIRDHYNEDPDSYSAEIHELETLRASATHAPRDFTGCSILKKYYSQLHFLLSRFPLTENPAIAITFNWYDIYSTVTYNVTDVKYEMACILYNIGALHSDLGAMDARNTPDGMKISCTHFQCAAWAFQHLRETYPQPRESDLSPTLLTFMNSVALAQAQECILEKSMTDNRKPTIIAKVAMQVVEYMKGAVKTLWSGKSSEATITEIVGSKKLKMWKKYCEFKMSYYGAVALLYQGLQAEEQQKMGERVAYYQAAVDMLMEATKLAKNLDQYELITECLTFSNDVMEGKLAGAQKENEFVYHEKVPVASTLTEVKGASLVKGIPFSVNDPEVSGQDIFTKLVPLEAHQASSMYSEEKAKLLRRIGSSIQERNDELETYLASMQLDSLVLDSDSEGLPQELIEYCADLNASNGIKKLTDTMAKISGFYHDINATMNEIKQLLEAEEEKEKEFLSVMGKRAPNMIVGELRREANKYREAQQSAQDNNTALHRAITAHLPNLELLSKPLDQLTAALPSLASVEGQGDPAAKQEVKRLLGKVREMQDQREKWEAQLRTDIHNDDVTKQLVTSQEDMEDFFKNELKKHDKLVSYLEQNMAAQTNILQALSEANAAYATTRRLTNQVQAQRTDMISSLAASYNAYINILKKAEDAQEFYRKLEGQVNKLSSRVRSVCRVQDEEREEVLSANVKKFTGGTIPKGTGLPSQPPVGDPGPSSVSGPKLKDYLQYMKGGSGIGAGVAMSGTMTHPQPQGQPGYAYSDPSGASYSSSMRPAPLGSEQSDPQTSCAGQGGYMAGYAGQVSAYHPSAPSPAPSPAPQSSGSPYKTPYGATGGPYYPHQAAISAYPGATSSSAYPTPQSSSVPSASAPSATATSTAPQSAAAITAGQPSSYTVSGTSTQHQTPYGYSSGQYPYYGYQNVAGMTPSGPGQGSPHHAGQKASPQHQAGTGGYDAAAAAHTSTSNSQAGVMAATGGTAQTSLPAAAAVGQGYYGYYHQQQQHPGATAATTSASVPATVSSGATTTQPSFPQYPYQFAPTRAVNSVSSMYSQAGSMYSANYRPDTMSPSGGVHGSQNGYTGQNNASKGPTSTTSATPAHSSQGTGYSSGMYPGAYAGGASTPAQSSVSTNTGIPSPQAGGPTAQWNMYSNYPQAGISSTSVSLAGGGRAPTNTSMSGSYQASSSTTPSTTTTAGAAVTSISQIPGLNAMQYSQYAQGYTQPMMWAQYGTGSQQRYQQPQHQPQRPTQPQQQQYSQQQYPHQQQYPYPQQYPQSTQQRYSQQQPQPPQATQQQYPQQPTQSTQVVATTTTSTPSSSTTSASSSAVTATTSAAAAAAMVPTASTGISNLDLLSGIELTSPAASQWSPLTPQPAGGRQGGEAVGNSTTVAAPSDLPSAAPPPPPPTLSQSGAAPDLTSTATSYPAAQVPSSTTTNLPNVVSGVSL